MRTMFFCFFLLDKCLVMNEASEKRNRTDDNCFCGLLSLRGHAWREGIFTGAH